MSKYNYYPEDDGYDDSAERSMRAGRTQRPTLKKTKLEFPHGIQRPLSEAQRPVVAIAIKAALADHPAPKFKPSFNAMPLSIVTATSSAILYGQSLDLTPGQERSPILAFNRRVDAFIDRTNQQRPTVAAAAHSIASLPFKDARRKQTSFVAGVRLGGEGAQTVLGETQQALSELGCQREPSSLLPFFTVGTHPAAEVTENFAWAMQAAQLVQHITAALRSDANPDGHLVFGALEPVTP